MTEEQFWKLIGMFYSVSTDKVQLFSYDQLQIQQISKFLIKNGQPAIQGFQVILCQKIRELYQPKIGELYYLTTYHLSEKINQEFKFISSDGFVDFRAWIVSLGQDNFGKLLNFKTEEELLAFDFDPNIAWREDLVYLAESVAEDLGYKVNLDYHFDGDDEALYANMQWKGLNKKYPKLFKKYQAHF